MSKISELFKNIWYAVETCFLASKFYFSMKLVAMLATTAIPLLNYALWREILNGIADYESSGNRVIVCLALYLALTMLTYILNNFSSYVENRYTDEIRIYFDKILMEKTSRVELSFFDSASENDKLNYVRSHVVSVMYSTVWQTFSILSSAVNVTATLIIVTAYKWWLGLLTLALLVPYLLYNQSYAKKRMRMEKEQLRDNRKKDYCYSVFFNNDVQFEIKLYGIGDFFIKRYKSLWEKLYRINRREDVRHSIISLLILLLNLASEVIVLAVSAVEAAVGVIGVGDLQYNLSMVSTLRSEAESLVSSVNDFAGEEINYAAIHEFMRMKTEGEKSGTKIPSDNPKIEFCGVSFHYPNSEEYVLRDCSFTINPHEKVGLIGVNGAGKSTIVKLMFRLYDPQEGQILLDGVDIKEYDIYALRRIFGVLFQDYVTYSLPLREIIALSDFDERFNDEKLRRACDISGASEIIKDWDDGFDSVLGRNYEDNGKDLSGGQWQTVGLARAYFKDSEYMVLDEPSAALDPVSEDRIFEQLYHLSEGKSSVTISHRLSNTTLADKILVIEDGHIIEEGSHRELLMKNGRYAQLFNLQAEKYV
ncbi:MAG: ABC transporter ATP-binding protein/permease [Firmicutes bacterium]|nr:ABC transporter ATP-binding protein/permease [Bacillota bacterium]